MRSITVALNGVYQQLNEDFVTKGHSIVFKRPPTGTVDIGSHTNNKTNMTSYTCTGQQTTFHLPAYPVGKFQTINDYTEAVPAGYTVVDVNFEIETWIRDNCSPSEWKWADQLNGTSIGTFGLTRLIVKDSVLTYIATKWSE